MAAQDAVNAARFAYTAYDTFLMGVAQEIGLDCALEVQAKAMEAMGTAQGQMLKEQTGIEQADAQMVYGILSQMLDGVGFATKVMEAGPERVTFRAAQCPIYEAGRLIGLDHTTIEAICRSGGICTMDAVTRQLNPNLRYQLRTFRSSAEAGCVEEIVAV
jgi:predicted ArsR family transcriptional regulator